MFKRFVERRADEALSDTPVVLIVGPRRAGKTTLVKSMGEAGRTYITLDDQTVLEAARSDPAGFIRGLDRAIIDEIQRAPDLLLAVKKTVDEDYRPGRFLLTGSAKRTSAAASASRRPPGAFTWKRSTGQRGTGKSLAMSGFRTIGHKSSSNSVPRSIFPMICAPTSIKAPRASATSGPTPAPSATTPARTLGCREPAAPVKRPGRGLPPGDHLP